MNAGDAAAATCALLDARHAGFDAALDALIAFEAAQDPSIDATVAAIIADVRARGDAACSTTRGASTASTQPRCAELAIAPAAMQRAFDALAGAQRDALQTAADAHPPLPRAPEGAATGSSRSRTAPSSASR